MAGYWLSSQSGNSSALRFPLGNTLLSSSFHKPQTLQNGIFLTSALLLPLLHGKTNQARSTNIYLEKPQPFRMFYTLIHLEKDMMRLKKSQIILIGFIFLPFFSFPSPSVQEQPLTDSYVALPSKKVLPTLEKCNRSNDKSDTLHERSCQIYTGELTSIVGWVPELYASQH